MNLGRISVNRPLGTLALYGIVLLIGLVSLLSLPIELLPELSFPRLTISTDYPGAGPEEVENLVSRILEEAASTVSGVQEVTSTSTEGSSRVTATFPSGTDLDAAANDLRAAVERARRRLPEEATNPVVFKFDPSQFPIIQLGLIAEGKAGDPVELGRLADDQIIYRLERVPGVALVDTRGGLRRQILVELDSARARTLGVAERDVVSSLNTANLASPVGEVIEGERRLGLRALSRYENLEQIRRTVVTYRNGVPIYVKDVARVGEGAEEARGLVRINGQRGIQIQVQRTPGENTVAISNRVLREVGEINEVLSDARLVVIGDNARFIRSSIRGVQQAILIGGFLAVGVLLFFLRDIRSVLVIATAIPTSVVASFALMYFFGYTLNLMTMGGLALSVGMLMDASIVVLENVFRHRELGFAPKEAATAGAGEVTGAIIASTLTSVVVFLPVVFQRGGPVTTQLFFTFAAVVGFSQLCALIVALTLIPLLASWLPPMRRSLTESGWTGWLIGRYREILGWAVHHRPTVFLASGMIFFLGTSTFMLIGREVLPQTDEGEIFVSIQLPTGTPLAQTSEVASRLEGLAREAAPEIVDVTQSVGSASFGGQRSHRASLRIRLAGRSERSRNTEEIATELRERLRIPGGRVTVRPSAGALSVVRFGESDPIAVDVRGFDLGEATRLANEVRDALEGIPGVTDVSVAREEQVPEVAVRVDAERAAAFGLTPAQISTALRTSVAGSVATIFRESGRETDIVVRLRESDRLRGLNVLSIPITAPGGRQILLGQVAELTRGVGPAEIFRRGRERVVTITAGLSGRDFGSAMSDVRVRLSQISLPPGFAIAFGQQYEEQQRAYRYLGFGFLVAIILVYAVMVIQFEAWREPLLIMGAIPFSLSGAFLTLFLTGTTLNIQSLIGLIVLAGIVVNNAIVLIDFILVRRRRDQMSLYEAAVDASVARLRPVLMTTITTCLGLLPIAIGIGEGAELQAPLARSVLGGLLLGTLVTLVFIPTLYVGVEEARGRGFLRIPRRVRVGLRRPAPVEGGADPAP